MKRAAADALDSKSNQYPPMLGVPELRAAVAAHARRHSGQRVSAEAGEVLVTSGATEGIAAALLGLCNPGDRVVVFEPLYDAYAGIAAASGVELAAVRLRPPGWSLPPPPPSAAAAAPAPAAASSPRCRRCSSAATTPPAPAASTSTAPARSSSSACSGAITSPAGAPSACTRPPCTCAASRPCHWRMCPSGSGRRR